MYFIQTYIYLFIQNIGIPDTIIKSVCVYDECKYGGVCVWCCLCLRDRTGVVCAALPFLRFVVFLYFVCILLSINTLYSLADFKCYNNYIDGRNSEELYYCSVYTTIVILSCIRIVRPAGSRRLPSCQSGSSRGNRRRRCRHYY